MVTHLVTEVKIRDTETTQQILKRNSGNNGGNQESWSNGDTFSARSKNQRHRN